MSAIGPKRTSLEWLEFNLSNNNFHVFISLHCCPTPDPYRKAFDTKLRQGLKLNRVSHNIGYLAAIVIFAAMGSTALAATVLDFIWVVAE